MMRSRQQTPRLEMLFIALSALTLAGCATFSDDGGLASISEITRERTGHSVQRVQDDGTSVQSTIRQLIAQPLTPDTAVQIALLNNRGLQASLADLGIAEADLVQAGRMRNPGFSFGRMRGGSELEIERSIMFDLAGLLTMPMRSKVEGSRFEQAKLQAASEAIQLAADSRKAYFNAVAAQQTVMYMEQVASAAEAGAGLAQQLTKVGNWSKLAQAREQVFYADAIAQLARARHNATASREQLTRHLGLWGRDAAFTLPARLPDIPKTPNDAADIESQAMTQRLDVNMAKRDAEATARVLGFTRASGFINVFDAGYANKSASGKPRENGYEISLELPIFDWGGARMVKAEATYMQAVHRVADTAVKARSEVREAYSAYRSTYDLARHYSQEIVPLRKKISDEVLLRYNGMLASVFELLSDSRAQINSVNAAIEAQRDFWLAETDLQAAVNGNGGAPAPLRAQASDEAAVTH